jgi:hypothetical protein
MGLNHLPNERRARNSENHAYLRVYTEDDCRLLQVQYRTANILAGNRRCLTRLNKYGVPRNSAALVRTTLVPNAVAGGRGRSCMTPLDVSDLPSIEER